MEREKTATFVPVVVLLAIVFFFYLSNYLWTLGNVLFPDADKQWPITLVMMTSLALMMGIAFAVDAVRFEGSQPVLRWPVSSIIMVYSCTTGCSVSADSSVLGSNTGRRGVYVLALPGSGAGSSGRKLANHTGGGRRLLCSAGYY